MLHLKATLVLVLSAVMATLCGYGQGCQTTVVVRLENIKGGFFEGQDVTLTSRADGKVYSGKSAANGEAVVSVPCNEVFDLAISNYTKKEVVESSNLGRTKHTFSYPHDMVEKEKQWAMTSDEQKRVDESFASLPDTTSIKGSLMPPPKVNAFYHTLLTIAIRDLYKAPLQNEVVTLTGRKRNKSFRGVTDKNGRLLIYVPKGDTYDISFKYNKKYYTTDCPYSKGNSDIRLGFSYMGTREKEKRMKEEKERILAEEKRLKEERERFEKECKSLGLTLEECHRKKIEDYLKGVIGNSDTVVMKSFRRNRWQDKLIVVDVTGSMSPYVAQVAMWYRLNHLKENNLQFVLFNDGNNMPDDRKKIGETGGIYYQRSKGVDSLDAFMGRVQALGGGGDGPENNMEALIKGVKMAEPFKELIMIADNHAPVKDISLLSQFSVPVHIILCGTSNTEIWPDYLKIAWKTKGSVHTIEDDIVTLAKMSEGQQVKIGGTIYKIMGGEFVALPKP
jgi:hypothetical protein